MRPREKEMLATLTNRVRVMTLDQVARTWWSEKQWGVSRAKKALCELADAGWVNFHDATSRPICRLQHPLFSWQPADSEPDFSRLSQQLHRRAMVPAEIVPVVYATSKSNSLFGEGTLPKVKPTQMTHDLHVAEIFLTYRAAGLRSSEWVGEDQFPYSWPIQQRPDAILVDRRGVVIRAIEYGGDYSTERLDELHDGLSQFDCHGLAYEIW